MTKPIRVPTRAARFARLFVWHPINTDPADEDRWGPRFWYPTYDLIAIALGLYAYAYGSPLLNSLFPEWFVNVVAVALVTFATVCLLGVCIPRLALYELVGKLGLVFILGSYAGTVWFMSGSTEPNGFVVIALFMAIWLLGPRISKLFVMVPKILRANREARPTRGAR